MGLFGFLKKRKIDGVEEEPLPWEILSDIKQLDEIKARSHRELIAIFKHSTRCPVSRMALRMFEKGYNRNWEHVQVYVLDLLAHRAISDEVATRFQVWHESPQLLLIKNWEVVYHASHAAITPAILPEYLD